MFEAVTPSKVDSPAGVSPSSRSVEHPELSKYLYESPPPSTVRSSSPLKRKSILPDISSPYSNKRITRSTSSASLNSASVSDQKVFPPPIKLAPSPSTTKARTVSAPTWLDKISKEKKQKAESTAPSLTQPTNLLRDALVPDLYIMFVGVNPGLQTAATGYAYAHRTNLFYPLLYEAGITPQQCHPSEYHSMVERFGLGHTNMIQRATRDASVLSKKEMEGGVPNVEAKVRLYKPGCVVLVGKSIWEAFERVWTRKGIWKRGTPFKYGWIDAWIGGDEDWPGARLFVATSTSGLAASLPREEKVRIWKELGSWYQERVAATVSSEKEGTAEKDEREE